MKEKADWYRISDIATIDSPALVIYMERVQRNINLAKSMVGDVGKLRPHVKTHKSLEGCSMLLEAGIRKFKCATIAEAEMLAIVKAPDVLLAYQPVGPKVDRLISLIQRYPETMFSCLVDNWAAAESLSTKASLARIRIRAFLDLNVGMNRTGIVPGENAIRLYEQCRQLEGIQLIGLHVYDGHIADSDFQIRKQRCEEAFIPVERMRSSLVEKGIPQPLVVAGGSPSFPVHSRNHTVECSPGTFIYWDAGYQKSLAEQSFQPAALVITRIISLPNETTICTDLGHKSISAENPLDKRVFFLNAPELQLMGQSEEHALLRAFPGHSYKIGEVLYGIPFHICPTCALYEKALLVENGNTAGEWKTVARDRKILS